MASATYGVTLQLDYDEARALYDVLHRFVGGEATLDDGVLGRVRVALERAGAPTSPVLVRDEYYTNKLPYAVLS